jgi:hypothetical protein
MSFRWARYLDLANELAGKLVVVEGREAKLRSAISRAYYAAFHHARDYVVATHGQLPYSINEHEYVKNWFLNQRDRLLIQIGTDLDRLRQDRNRADYTDEWRGGIGALDKTVDTSLQMAARTIANVARLGGA